MLVGYGVLGRVLEMDPAKWGVAGGDNEAPALLLSLAKRNPDHKFVCLAQNQGWESPLPNILNPWPTWNAEIKKVRGKLYSAKDMTIESAVETCKYWDWLTGPTYESFDGIVAWVGQHGSSNSPLPSVKDRSILTKPYESCVRYGAALLRGVNRWREPDPLAREEVWLTADPRNYIQAHDLKWPHRHQVLAQFNFRRKGYCERYDDPRTPTETGFPDATSHDGYWRFWRDYAASGLELVGIDLARWEERLDWSERKRFGVLMNENRNYGYTPTLTRLHILQEYVLPLGPDWVNGAWSKKSLATLGFDISPLKYGVGTYNALGSVKSTFTTPASGSNWATAKPWECFATGTICFFHPSYDTQGHVIPNLANDQGVLDGDLLALAQWLRVKDPEDLRRKVEAVNSSEDTYNWLVHQQNSVLLQALKDQRAVTTIERRLGL